MFNRMILVVSLSLLSGCVNLGKVGMHPQLKTSSFSASMDRTYRCLDSEAIRQALRLTEDDRLPGGGRRYNLLDQHNAVVAWLDMNSSGKQTSIDLFYGRSEPQTERQLLTMVKQCQRELD
ncbi:hypothetical protein EDF81_2208 [Enterobacter sp. BIGb0383]|uniref:hypothetical protein n=1 Tax=unclassified Enterobacter TaxID=2608935 RepID=UPI000F460E87|nr:MULTISPECIES: hypothetical protein [unclassified Enterobacter]ROP59406.1 hypothetical protein EDF81_2208 [Enterobacter sp. BIGb0383]ROS09128.1 hypothetical protein EC848_2634 [Enterobacter sp. BIGb0359]